ncbi:MAG: DNA mismatch repair protein MutS [Deltaproteobacteria bacterium]|nr:DNA mismatch repair protein MutS [Deltaproteobacteria bacterium]
MSDLTPMLKQYMGIKSDYPDAILFYRMGDFYEMFFEDARVASRLLGIALTSRGTHRGEKVPMCGIPHHASRSYIAKLIDSGCKVAICEQVEDSRETKGIVKRDVVRVITPASAINEGEGDGKYNVYMAAVSGKDSPYGMAFLDLSTGEFRVTEIEQWGDVLDELARIGPAELLLLEKDGLQNRPGLSAYRLEVLPVDVFQESHAEKLLKKQLGVQSLAGFGCELLPQGITAAGTVVYYIQKTQKTDPIHIKEIITYHLCDYLFLDEPTVRSLELFRTVKRQSSKGSLFNVLDKTVTPMGSRQLAKWIGYPLLDLKEIRRRLAAVSSFRDDNMLRETIQEELTGIYDMERLNSRISLRRANARDLVSLNTSVKHLPAIKDLLEGSASELLYEIGENLDPLEDVARLIENAICSEPPISTREGGMIREGYDFELDKLITATRDGKSWIAQLAASEQKRTGISSLKIGYNRVFGYYIEVSKTNLHLVPTDYMRKQTLANGERYITERLKEYEDLILGAEEKRVAMESDIFEEIREKVATQNRRIKEAGRLVGEVDVLAGLAETAELNRYVCPEMSESPVIEIIDSRHPVIEQTMKEEPFVPNDIHIDDVEQQLLIITGPNMAGKSTILRQVALTALMAQMGSFVPASRAIIGIVDRIFTRIGASDDVTKGQSTFMVEMNETANIIRHATPKSLVILDEIGRGTSTYDGLSIAWAIAEALHDRNTKGVRTLFATHYHELTELVATKSRIKNFNIAVKEWNDRILFLRKLIPGGTSRSYGIQVARIAGLPDPLIRRAKEILDNLEGKEVDEAGLPKIARSKETGNIEQLQLFGFQEQGLRKWIKGLNTSEMTPLEALIELSKMKDFLERQS